MIEKLSRKTEKQIESILEREKEGSGVIIETNFTIYRIISETSTELGYNPTCSKHPMNLELNNPEMTSLYSGWTHLQLSRELSL